MMNEHTKHNLDILRSLALREDTKARMREALLSYSDEHPVRAEQNTFALSAFMTSRRFSLYGSFVAAFIVLGGGVTLAAEGSQPGDIFYPIKTGISEPIMTAFATTDAEKVRVASTLAVRRIDEITALAASGSLTDEKQATLEHSFDQNIQIIEERTNALADQGDSHTALALREEFTASLAGEVPAVAAVAQHASPRVKEFIVKVRMLSGEHQEPKIDDSDAAVAVSNVAAASASSTPVKTTEKAYVPRALQLTASTSLPTLLKSPAVRFELREDRAVQGERLENEDDGAHELEIEGL